MDTVCRNWTDTVCLYFDNSASLCVSDSVPESFQFKYDVQKLLHSFRFDVVTGRYSVMPELFRLHLFPAYNIASIQNQFWLVLLSTYVCACMCLAVSVHWSICMCVPDCKFVCIYVCILLCIHFRPSWTQIGCVSIVSNNNNGVHFCQFTLGHQHCSLLVVMDELVLRRGCKEWGIYICPYNLSIVDINSRAVWLF